MDLEYIESKVFKTENFTESALPKAEYDTCHFEDCTFTGASLSGITFAECEFRNCDLSNVQLKGTTFREVSFHNCKLLGLRFDECDPFLLSFNFDDCILNFSFFYKLKLKGIRFINCKLQEVDFSEANLMRANFHNSDLGGAIFDNTNLANADMQTAYNFSIDPERNQLQKSKFSGENIKGLLDKYKLIIK
ncbi:pentapeptide repeat-containing protein [Gillisia sp. M10.2A]|uniref:Pentapeptide repeat-containing protein n=1 Tax=Gillisia lutea TaxID=2909668 RepID=A0ABS9EI79_9FLAO|nr:pentapeptide repeat-containing protein [Gillisia lutea]MCF4101163.1 pentapeptide repeat-containing protein [Gillisia lutea]